MQSNSPVRCAALLCKIRPRGACKEGIILHVESTGISCYGMLPGDVAELSEQALMPVAYKWGGREQILRQRHKGQNQSRLVPPVHPRRKRRRRHLKAKAITALASSAPAGRTAKVSAVMHELFDVICCPACVSTQEANHSWSPGHRIISIGAPICHIPGMLFL